MANGMMIGGAKQAIGNVVDSDKTKTYGAARVVSGEAQRTTGGTKNAL